MTDGIDERLGILARLADLLGAQEPALRLLTSILLGNRTTCPASVRARAHT